MYFAPKCRQSVSALLLRQVERLALPNFAEAKRDASPAWPFRPDDRRETAPSARSTGEIHLELEIIRSIANFSVVNGLADRIESRLMASQQGSTSLD
jgi:hypothetical protein